MIAHHIDTLRGSLGRLRKAALAIGDRAVEVASAEADDQILADALSELEELRRTLDTREEELRVFRSSASLASSLIESPPAVPSVPSSLSPSVPGPSEPDRAKLRALHKIQLFASGADDVALPPDAARGLFKAINHLALDALCGA